MTLHHIALVRAQHTGPSVLVDNCGRLPTLMGDDSPLDTSPAYILDVVGGSAFIAPRHQLGRNEYLDVVTQHPGSQGLPDGGDRGWTGLAGWSPGDPIADAVRRAVTDPGGPLRPEWYFPEWASDIESWIDSVLPAQGLRRTGPVRLHRIWSITAVAQVPTDGGPRWLKVSGGPFTSEASVTDRLAERLPDLMPAVTAADRGRGRLLLEPLPVSSLDESATLQALAAAYVPAQIAALDWCDEVRRWGAASRTAVGIQRGWDRLVTDGPNLQHLTPAEIVALRRINVADMLAQLVACGVPDTLMHGDLHLGNVAYDGRTLRVFDWTDAAVGHPFFDIAHVLRIGESADPPDARLVAAFLDPWRVAFPRADVDRALVHAARLDPIVTALAFDGIARHTEAASWWEMSQWGVQVLRRVISDATTAP